MYTVTMTDSNQNKQTFTCGENQSLLTAARAQGVKIHFACNGGGCGLCKIKVEEGQFELGKSSKKMLPDEERAENYALACKTHPKSDLKFRVQYSK